MVKQNTTLEGQQAFAEVLFNSIGEGAVTTDEYGRITRFNPTAEKILGYSEKEAIGKWFPTLFSAYDEEGMPIPLIERPVTRAFVSGAIISQKIFYKNKNGRIVPIFMTISPIMVKNQPLGCIEIFRDITKESEIDKMKSDFISLASHQLRTPLSAIKTYSHMLLDGFMGPLSKPQTKSLKTIVSATNRMNETISTLLNVTRIESGSVAVARSPVILGQVIEEVINEHRLSSSDKKIKISFTKPPHAMKIISDSIVLKEILTNIIGNAVKYTPAEGNVAVEVKIEGNEVIISVADTGLGIPKGSQDNVFSKFFRAENVVRQETSGTGLGLYMVKRLVGELGGNIWFESEENQGSTFYVSMPMLPSNILKETVRK